MVEHRIFEKRLPLNHSLLKRIFGESSFSTDSEAYGQVVYFDEFNPKVITARLVYIQNSEVEHGEFVNLLEEDRTFNECLIISTLYFAQSISIIERMLSKQNDGLPDCLEHILKSTNGFIIYAFQFEQLAQLILDISDEEAINLRKSFNKRAVKMDRCELDDENWTLFKSIIRERCSLNVVYKPNYAGAKNLMLYAKSIA